MTILSFLFDNPKSVKKTFLKSFFKKKKIFFLERFFPKPFFQKDNIKSLLAKLLKMNC